LSLSGGAVCEVALFKTYPPNIVGRQLAQDMVESRNNVRVARTVGRKSCEKRPEEIKQSFAKVSQISARNNEEGQDFGHLKVFEARNAVRSGPWRRSSRPPVSHRRRCPHHVVVFVARKIGPGLAPTFRLVDQSRKEASSRERRE